MSEPANEARLDREPAIIDAFVHLADTLIEDFDVIDFLHYLTAQCVELTEIDEAAVMLAAPSGHLQAVASSSERSHMLELFELQNQDGPCLDAYRTGTVVSSPDLAAEHERWPTFAPHAIVVGFHSVHSIPLRLRNTVIGALNLLSVDAGAMPEEDQRLARALSDIATIGVLQERSLSHSNSTAAGLQEALNSRIRIEQAKGIIAERSSVSIDEAFDRLRAYARSNRLGLTDVAVGVVNRTVQIS